MAEKYIAIVPESAAVRPTMGEDISHPLQQMTIACSYEAGDAAHLASVMPPPM